MTILSPRGNPVVARFWDRQGNVLPGPDGAYVGEITEVINGFEERTYVDQSPAEDGLPLSDWGMEDEGPDLEDQDWLKGGAWDIRDPLTYDPAETVEQLLRALYVSDLPLREQVQTVCHQLELPSWGPAPVQLKIETYKWITDNRAILG